MLAVIINGVCDGRSLGAIYGHLRLHDRSTVEMTIMQTIRRRQNLCNIQFMHYKFDKELKLNWWRQTLCNIRFMHYNLCITVETTVYMSKDRFA